jgi:hypothetical protein
VIAGGPLVGPHAIGNEECDPELGRCETKGSFLGLGGQLELRARVWRLVYVHGRGLAVGNVSTNDRIHRGLWGLGAGAGLLGRRAFGRAEYLFVSTFGDNRFEPPFFEGCGGVRRVGPPRGHAERGLSSAAPSRARGRAVGAAW